MPVGGPIEYVEGQIHGILANNLTGTITLKVLGEEVQEAACSDGSIASLFGVVDRVVEEQLGFCPILVTYSLKALHPDDGGADPVTKEAQARVTVTVQDNGARSRMTRESGDVLEAGVLAYVAAVNSLYRKRKKGGDGSENIISELGR